MPNMYQLIPISMNTTTLEIELLKRLEKEGLKQFEYSFYSLLEFFCNVRCTC